MSKDFKEVIASMKAAGENELERIAHVQYKIIEKTGYSFHFFALYEKNGKDILTEMLYDLRYKEYYLLRNGKKVAFNIANIDLVVPREREYHWQETAFSSKESTQKFFQMVSVEENKGMYQKMLTTIGSMGEERVSMTSRALIRLITEYNKLELIYKSGFTIPGMEPFDRRHRGDGYRAVRKFFAFVENASKENKNKLHQIFGVTKSQLKFIRELTDNNIVKMMLMMEELPHLSQKDMDTYRGYRAYIEELEERYNLEGRADLFERNSGIAEYITSIACKKEGRAQYHQDFFAVVQGNDYPNPLRLLEYLLFECYLSQGCDYSNALSEYRDYYRMCKDLEYENFERYPKYLKTSHDIVAMNYKLVEDEVTTKKFMEMTEQYRYLEEVVGDFALCVPGKTADLVTEGNVLHHCVGSYVRNVAKGNTQIMFLRDKKAQDVPLVTVEVRNNAIVQARGFGNRQVEGDEITALHKYAKKRNLKVNSYF